MNNRKILLSIGVIGVLSSFSAALLINHNLERNYRIGEYIQSENAYYGGKVTDSTGLIKAHKFVTPTDGQYNSQKTRSLGTYFIGDIESVWSAYTGKGTTVAIIDDGFDINHPEYVRSDGTSAILSTSRNYYIEEISDDDYELRYQNYSDNPSCIEEDWDSSEYEWATHGTATSTTAAAPMNNGGGVGIAPDANILALKIDFTFVAIEEAIRYAVDQGVDVINMSLGAYSETFVDGWGDTQKGSSAVASYLNSACQYAYNHGVIVVAAAGNESTWHKSYPACNYKVVGVGAIGDKDNKGNANELAEFTNYVSTSQTGEINVDILAPGYVYTAEKHGSHYSVSHTYADTQGTSFSSPIVAGAACLWKQKYPNGTPDEFLSQLQSSASGIGTYQNKMIPVSGWGSSYSDVGPSNITNGRLNVANLLDIDEPYVSTTQSTLNIAIGEQKQIDLQTSNGVVTYSSNNNSVATVSSSGLVEGKSSGTTKIIITATKSNKTATTEVTVNVSDVVSASAISFNPKSVTLDVGQSYNAEETLQTTPNNANRIFMFESDNSSVASVNEDTGVVTAISAGTAHIYATAIYGNGEDTLTITVQGGQESKEGTIYFGNGDGRTNVNSVSVNGTDSVNNNWTVTTAGTTSFTPAENYSQIGSSKSPASSITFSMSLSSSVTFKSVSASLGGFNGTAGAVAIKVGTTTIGSGNLSGSSDVTVNSTSTASGTNLSIGITNISKGVKAYSISYSYETSGGSSTPSVTSVTVSPSSVSLDLNGTKNASLTATVNGTNNPSQTVSWSSSNTAVATVSSSGYVTGVGKGTTTITATSTLDSTKSGTCTVTVVDTTPTPKTLSSISISGQTTALQVGSEFVFGGTVTAHFSDNSSSDVTSSATFDGYNMNVAGVYTVTVSYTYSGTTKTTSYQLTVNQSSGGEQLFDHLYDYDEVGDTWTISNSTDSSNYYLCPASGAESIVVIPNIFLNREIVSDVVITINSATYGSGSSPTTDTYKIYSDSDCSNLVSSNRTGTLPYSSTYTDVIYTVEQIDAGNNFIDDLVIKITKPGRQIRLKSIDVEFDYIAITDKIIGSLEATYSGEDIFINGSLDESKISVTAKFTDSSKYEDEVLDPKYYSLSEFDSSTCGEKELTVTYTGNLPTLTSPLTTTLTINVIEDTVISVIPTNLKTYHPGECISKDDITVTLKYKSGLEETTTDFDFVDDGYQFTYEDASSGGGNSNKQFYITRNSINYVFSVKVSREKYVAPVNETKNLNGDAGLSAGINNSQNNYTGKIISGVTCNATNIYTYSQSGTRYFSFGKIAGEIHNTVALTYPISSISLSLANNSRTDIYTYVSVDGSNWVNKDTATFENGNYRYFKVETTSTSDSYSNFNITINLKGEESALNLANYIMYEDTNNQCTTKLDTAISIFNSLSKEEKTNFMTSESYVICKAEERLSAWLRNQGKSIDYINGDYVVSNRNDLKGGDSFTDSSSSPIIIVTAVFLITSATCILLIKKKRNSK